MENKTKHLSLHLIELIFGVVYLITNIILARYQKFGILSMFSSLMIIAFAVLMIIFRKRHVYFKLKPAMFFFSLYYKLFALGALIFIFANYTMKDVISIVLVAICILYMIFAYIVKKQYNEMFNAYVYWQIVTLFFLFF